MLAVSVTKMILEEGIFLNTPLSVVTMESVLAPFVNAKFKLLMVLGVHCFVVLFHCKTCPAAGTVFAITFPISLLAFHMGCVVWAVSVQVLPTLDILIEVLSPLICTAPTWLFKVVTPLLNVPNCTHALFCLK